MPLTVSINMLRAYVFFIAGPLLAAIALSSAADPARAADPRKVVVPFDFVSKFDNGRYGEMVGDQIWKKLSKEGGFIIPESMADVRDVCRRNKFQPAPDLPLAKMKKIVEDYFGGQIGIWGSVERAAGEEWEVYDLVIKCVDFSARPAPKVIYEVKARTKSVSEIPHVYVKNMLDALYQRKPAGPPPVSALVEENWRKNPNLVPGGDFESGVRGGPKGLVPVAGQQREPLGGLVRWIPEAGHPRNHVIRFSFDANVGDNEGVMYYSEPFPVEAGAKYRFQCRWRTNGPNVKVFIKCYDQIGTEYRKESEATTSLPRLGKNDYVPPVSQMREVYRSQQNLTGPKSTWNTHTEDFTPRHTQYTPRWGRVMLYAYLGAGVVEFDDVVIKQIAPAPSPGEQNQERRPSLETKVTTKEIQENERRSREAKQKQQGERQERE
jgi:hypothetical protein